MRLLIFGGRHTLPQQDARLWAFLDTLTCPDLVISGCALGADQAGEHWAGRNGVPVCQFPADWDRYGPSAGPRRNQQMLEKGKPTHGVALWDGVSKGTLDMLKRLVSAGVPVRIVPMKETSK